MASLNKLFKVFNIKYDYYSTKLVVRLVRSCVKSDFSWNWSPSARYHCHMCVAHGEQISLC